MDDLEDKQHALLFDVRRSVRYHRRRGRFFDLWGKVTSGLNIVAGSAAAGSFLAAQSVLAACAGLVVVVASTIDLVVSSSMKARDHFDLAKRFIGLEIDLERQERHSEASLRAITERRLLIEADEPDVLRTLDLMCHNELVRALGYGQEQMKPIGWLKRQLAQFVSFDADATTPKALAPPVSKDSKTLPS
jgi:hypothetical protein